MSGTEINGIQKYFENILRSFSKGTGMSFSDYIIDVNNIYVELLSGNTKPAIVYLERRLAAHKFLKEKYSGIPLSDPKNSIKDITIIKDLVNGDTDEEINRITALINYLNSSE